MKLRNGWVGAQTIGTDSKRQAGYRLFIISCLLLLALPVMLLIIGLQLIATIFLVITGRKQRHSTRFRPQKIEKVINPN
ncbi:hypothetical protein [Motilimonas pumila]|uniref:Uncharacterized protein n=1 Tax=Motilimonas pumila TaxID=2303987 RepID=A0A418YKH7_9GAMM|nr:hypothetical protein [Motilimonas pumila]RJG51475.1 hypothetical protein D1Z90_01715 [Motilimonas pumila]